MKEFYIKKECRLCTSEDLSVVLPLNNSPLCDAYVKEIKEQNFYSLNLCMCNSCGFVQIDTIIDPEIVYRDNLNVNSNGLDRHFESYAQDVSKFLDINEAKFIVDIDTHGEKLLCFFKQQGNDVLKIEPPYRVSNESNKNEFEIIRNFFNEDLAKEIVKNRAYADVITINNLYANIDDLINFTKALKILLAKDGVLIIESSYLLDMIDNMVFDFIYHEHLSYLSILPLVRFFKNYDMKLINLEKIDTKGGSMRYYFAKNNSKWEINSSVEVLIKKELDANININFFKRFEQKIKKIKSDLLEFLENYKDKKVVGYGASATSTTLITYFELDGYFSYLVDDNTDKIDRYSPGFNIPVYSSDKIEQDCVDLVVILAWRFYDIILAKRKKTLRNCKKIIIPLPELKVIDYSNNEGTN
ncbi:MAG: methyltransferase domain-containing protein [Campylobacterales bacterium]|nr:methyltransferase domain-containing protein [Campylobacterales bacterium]